MTYQHHSLWTQHSTCLNNGRMSSLSSLFKSLASTLLASLSTRPAAETPGSTPRHAPQGPEHSQTQIHEVDAATALRSARYSPEADGRPDPGEVVWTWIPYEEDASRGKDRPVVVLGRSGAGLHVVQMTSKDHDRDAAQEAESGRHWMDIGSGAWDPKRRPSEVRLDRVLWVPEAQVRREGATLPKSTFDMIVEGVRRFAD